jgi:hypothetical protein
MGGPEEEQNPSNTWDTSPPGGVSARQSEQENLEGGERGRAYIRPAPDWGQSKASLRVGPIEFKAGGKGAAAALAVGVVGSAAMIAVTAYVGLPVAVIVTMGVTPMVLAMVMILVGLLRS